MRVAWLVGGLLVVAVILLGVTLSIRSGERPKSPTVEESTTTTATDRFGQAFEVCKHFVQPRLKAPKTAKFRDFPNGNGEVQVTGSGAGPYKVTSTVDSEESPGATSRKTFTCTMTLTGNSWKLDDLSLV